MNLHRSPVIIRRWMLSSFFVAGAVCLSVFWHFTSENAHAVPPVASEFVDEDTLRLNWLNTGEDLQIETSQDVGIADPWLPQPGNPILQSGHFRQTIDVSGLDRGFYRLSEIAVDPTAPVFTDVPDSNQVLFPREEVRFTLSADDPNALDVTYLVESLPLPAGASLNAVTGAFTWKPGVDQVGEHAITFLATNGSSTGRLTLTFTVQRPPQDGTTSLAGFLLDTTDAVGGIETPVEGAAVSILGSGVIDVTGADGRFLLENIPGGLQVLDIATQNALLAPDGSPYAGFREAFTIVENHANVEERPFYLPRIAVESLTTVDPAFTTIVENETLGVSIVVPPHTAMMGDQEFTGQLSISNVPEALAPAALPEELGFGLLVTIQPVGVWFADPVPITFPNVDDFAPGNEVDIWSLDPDAGVFTIVGTGRVTPDGTRIETISGGVRAADWHGALGPGADGDGDGGDGGPGGCAAGFGSEVTIRTGALRSSFELPQYIEDNEAQVHKFVYHSNWAAPQVIVPVNAFIGVRSAVPERISSSLNLAGISHPEEIFISTAGFSEIIDEPFRTVSHFDATAYPSGLFPYSVRLTNHFVRSTRSTDVTGTAKIVNETKSPFGAGWCLERIQKVHGDLTDAQRLLVQSGDGDTFEFLNRLVGNFTIGAFGQSRAGSLSIAEGNQYDQARAAIAETFVNVAIKPLDELTAVSLADVDILLLHPLQSSTIGNVLSASEQDVLLNHVEVNGRCAIILADHDLGRAGFRAAIDAMVQPFGIQLGNGSGSIEVRNALSGTLTNGDHGLVDVIERPFGGATVTNAGIDARTAILSTSGELVAVQVPAGRLAPSSGEVLVLPDMQIFSDLGGSGLDAVSAHRSLFLNAILSCRIASISVGGSSIEFIAREDGSVMVVDPGNGAIRFMPDGRQMHFDANGMLRFVEFLDGRREAYTYNGALLTKITSPNGVETLFNYQNSLLKSVTTLGGRVTTFTHDAARDLTRVDFPDGSSRSYTYDERHLQLTETDGAGRQTQHIYDDLGQAIEARLPDGLVRNLKAAIGVGVVDPNSGTGTEDNPAPRTLPSEANSTFTDGAGIARMATHNSEGDTLEVRDGIGLIVSFERDGNGHPIVEERPNGQRYERVFDNRGNALSEKDVSLNSTWNFTYDNVHGGPRTIQNGVGNTTVLQYHESGNVNQIMFPTGRSVELQRDAAGRLTQASFGYAPVLYTYDSLGRTTANSRGQGATARVNTFAWTAQGQLRRQTMSGGRVSEFEYSAVGKLIKRTVPGGRDFEMEFNGAGDLTALEMPSGDRYLFTIDGHNQITSITDPEIGGQAAVETYAFTGDQKLQTINRADGTSLVYAYDQGGRLVSITEGAEVFQYEYQGASDFRSRGTSPDGVILDYIYNGDYLTGRAWSGAVAGSVQHAYDGAGNMNSIRVNNANNVQMTFDADELLINAGQMAVTRHPGSGAFQSSTLGGITETFTYDEFGQITDIHAELGANTIFQMVYTYDLAGRIASAQETIGGTTLTYEYTYDAAERLATVSLNGAQVSNYAYDTNNNPVNGNRRGAAFVAVADARDRVTQYGAVSAAYDNAGDLVTLNDGGAATFDYDGNGSLKSVDLADGRSIEYLVDGVNRRVGKKIDGALVAGWLYQDNLRPVAEVNAAGDVISRFVYANYQNVPDYMLKNGTTYRIIKDIVGSVRLIVDVATGAIAQRMDYDEWGAVINDTNPGFQPFGFAGGLYDTDTGLVRFGARDYAPQLTRWTTKDLVLSFLAPEPEGFYEYAKNDPINRVDWLGGTSCKITREILETSRKASASIREASRKISGPSSDGPSLREIQQQQQLNEMYNNIVQTERDLRMNIIQNMR